MYLLRNIAVLVLAVCLIYFSGEHFYGKALFVSLLLLSWFLYSFFKRCFFKIKSDGKAVLITGCDSGFGHMLAQKLDSMGFQVFACCLFPAGAGAAKLAEKSSQKMSVISLDVTSGESVQQALKFVNKRVGSNDLWAVVNNAGIYRGIMIEFTSVEDFKACMDVNTFGYLRVAKAFLPLLRKSKGRLVNVTSRVGHISLPFFAAYCMSKHAATSLTDCLRMELSCFGVSVIGIEPETFSTHMNKEDVLHDLFNSSLEIADPSVKQSYGERYIKKLNMMKEMYLASVSYNVNIVIDDLVSAICSQHPKNVYKPSRNMAVKIGLDIFSTLPTGLRDQLLRKFVPC